MIDTARLLPPVAPEGNARKVFFELFRPEFLQHTEPLSSDAFSSFSPAAEQQTENLRVAAATRLLLNKHIPAVAKLLAQQRPPLAGKLLTQFVQRHGVNVRLLGRM